MQVGRGKVPREPAHFTAHFDCVVSTRPGHKTFGEMAFEAVNHDGGKERPQDMDDKTKIEELAAVVNSLLTYAREWEQDNSNKISINPARSASAQTVRTVIEKAEAILAEVSK